MKSFIAIFISVILFASCATLRSPQRTAKKFAKGVSKGDYESAIKLCILDIKDDLQRAIDRGDMERISIDLDNCEITENEYGVDCSCRGLTHRGDGYMIFSMTEVDGIWMIYEIDFDDYRKNSDRKDSDQSFPKNTPQETISSFVSAIAKNKDKKALKFAIMDGIGQIRAMMEDPEKRPVKVEDISCHYNKKRTEVNCSCIQTNKDGIETRAGYEMVQVNKKWKITEYSEGLDVEKIVYEFVMALAEGECEKAKKLTTGSATETVQATIDAGCEPYETEILSIECEKSGDLVNCSCNEERIGMEMTFIYTLTKTSMGWKVSIYQKDMGMDLGGLDEAVEEVDMDVEVVDDPEEYDYVEMDYIEDREPEQDQNGEQILDFAEVDPQFPGGENAMHDWLAENIEYPAQAKENGEQGIVYVQFIVYSDGSINGVRVIRGVSDTLDAEAVRVVKKMPRWKPGEQAGKKVNVRYTIPIHFSLN